MKIKNSEELDSWMNSIRAKGLNIVAISGIPKKGMLHDDGTPISSLVNYAWICPETGEQIKIIYEGFEEEKPKPKSLGQQIIAEIIKQKMVSVSFPDPEVSHVLIWPGNADEQIEAVIASHQSTKELEELKEKIALYETIFQEIQGEATGYEGAVLNNYEIVDGAVVYETPYYPVKELRKLLYQAPKFLELPEDVQERIKVLRFDKFGIR